MNEAETRAEYIDPKLKESGWGVIEGSKILREFRFTDGKIETGGTRSKPEIADYVLVYKNRKLAVVEAKRESLDVGEGIAQAKTYAKKLKLDYTYSTNGKEIHEICMKTGKEWKPERFPTPDELWCAVYSDYNEWMGRFTEIPFENLGGTKKLRYYQELAVNRALDAIAKDKQRILLTLATGTGKTFIAFQLAWKLFHSRWNLNRDGGRQPRILFLADRNILADQAFNSFSAFPEDALVRIDPKDIRKKGKVPMNASVFFTIFQTFMSGENSAPYYGEYPPDFFDFIIIDECHRGGANNEGSWRGILEYFSPAVQLGLTATPKRKNNIDTYDYFGEPVYIYSLKEGVSDGFLTPFKVKRIQTTLDDYVYTPDDQIIEGEVEEGKVYEEDDFNKTIEIEQREMKRVKIVLSEIDKNEKTIIFCANQPHALLIRDFVNKIKDSSEPNYCVRVTANDGALGEQYLREFQDNDKLIPTILTTSQKLSTGVDARNVRNIVLMRPVNSIIEFKQIVGRGTRIFDGKEYFTIYDFVDAYKHFSDPEWDGEPINETIERVDKDLEGDIKERIRRKNKDNNSEEKEGVQTKVKLKIKLGDDKEREIQHMISTSFWSAEGKPISGEEFLKNLFGVLPEFFKDEEKLREIWSDPKTRKTFLDQIAELGYGMEELRALQKLVEAEKSDLFDVLSYVSFAKKPISRKERVRQIKDLEFVDLNDAQKDFLKFVLEKYIERGVEELEEKKLPQLLNLRYHTVSDAAAKLGNLEIVRVNFFKLQKKLYQGIEK